jgi:hypothetical protein
MEDDLMEEEYPPGSQGAQEDRFSHLPDPRTNPRAWTSGGGYLPPEFDPDLVDYQEAPPHSKTQPASRKGSACRSRRNRGRSGPASHPVTEKD